MTKDLTIQIDNQVGTFARAAGALGKAGVNIEGVLGTAIDNRGIVHFLVEDGPAAREALKSAGCKVMSETDVVVVDVQDRPGELARVTQKLADAKINLDLVYLATRTRVVIGCDNLVKARDLLQAAAVS
ncbi:MAG: ACT domain-containing protein [Candidatus Dormibacteria bacterium]